MTKDQPFDRAVLIPTNDLPSHIIQNINDLVTTLLIMGTVTNPNGVKMRNESPIYYDFNLSLAAMQKALGLLIQHFFKEESRDEVVEQCCTALRDTMKEGYKYDD